MENYLLMKSEALTSKATSNLENILCDHRMEFNLDTSYSLDETEFKLLIAVMKMIIEVINILNNFAKSIDANLNLLPLVHVAPSFILLEISELFLILRKNTLC
jgi:hypothetical protein